MVTKAIGDVSVPKNNKSQFLTPATTAEERNKQTVSDN